MGVRRVEIFKGPTGTSDIIGFKSSAADAIEHPDFAKFMSQRRYAWSPVDYVPPGSDLAAHVEVRPPLSEDDTRDFGTLCIGGYMQMYQQPIVDGSHDGIIVRDHREDITRWVAEG